MTHSSALMANAPSIVIVLLVFIVLQLFPLFGLDPAVACRGYFNSSAQK